MTKLRIVYTADFEPADCAEVIMKHPALAQGDYLKQMVLWGIEKNKGHIQYASITPDMEAPKAEAPVEPVKEPDPEAAITKQIFPKKKPSRA